MLSYNTIKGGRGICDIFQMTKLPIKYFNIKSAAYHHNNKKITTYFTSIPDFLYIWSVKFPLFPVGNKFSHIFSSCFSPAVNLWSP